MAQRNDPNYDEETEEDDQEIAPPPKKQLKGKKHKKASQNKAPVQEPTEVSASTEKKPVESNVVPNKEQTVLPVKEPTVAPAPAKEPAEVPPKEAAQINATGTKEQHAPHTNKTTAESVKEEARNITACAKECTSQCTYKTSKSNNSMVELIKCLEECKCDKISAQQMLESKYTINNLHRSEFGKHKILRKTTLGNLLRHLFHSCHNCFRSVHNL